ncbi:MULTISPECIES: hypothetical protein [unclassified Flavobacterium]|uniref:hypothetical protein n=1 Tax=unclassified Flavobacterium TaxID=196869 RepID=UPI001F13A6DE|nr:MULTISPECIES: hypothetical protein [unclassified Flavobacterium]UMY66010.1 hypothetical protein MKO97_01120 [Flavobacterium sp. HJ-32-4]
MKKFILKLAAIVLFFCSSCSKPIMIYKSDPRLGEDDVFAFRMDDFFNGNKRIKKLRIRNRNLLIGQLSLIKDSLVKCPELDVDKRKFGIYKYAFVVSRDTFYANSTLTGWRYKLHSGMYSDFDSSLKSYLSTGNK